MALTGCGSDKQAKSMEQIYAEKGVPVKVQEVKPQEFQSRLSYNAVLTGIEEASPRLARGLPAKTLLVRAHLPQARRTALRRGADPHG